MPARMVVVPLVSLGQEDDGVVTVVGGDDHLHDLDLPVVALSSGLCGGERAPVKGVGVRAIGGIAASHWAFMADRMLFALTRVIAGSWPRSMG